MKHARHFSAHIPVLRTCWSMTAAEPRLSSLHKAVLLSGSVRICLPPQQLAWAGHTPLRAQTIASQHWVHKSLLTEWCNEPLLCLTVLQSDLFSSLWRSDQSATQEKRFNDCYPDIGVASTLRKPADPGTLGKLDASNQCMTSRIAASPMGSVTMKPPKTLGWPSPGHWHHLFDILPIPPAW